MGDFPALHLGSWLSGRYTPIYVYGPSGDTPELGTKAFVEATQKAYAWDIATRSGALPDAGGKIEVTEFDYMQENAVVYEKNGVTIRSWPAIHSLDGSVSYSLEWNGLKYVFGGDTYPNKWYMEFAKDADVASHECFLPPEALAEYFGWSLTQATYVSTRIHCEPTAFGKIMSELKPRLAVGYHSVQSPENNAAIMDGVRSTYDGPLALARDLQVINVTKDDIKVRMASVDEYVLPPDVTASLQRCTSNRGEEPIREGARRQVEGLHTAPHAKQRWLGIRLNRQRTLCLRERAGVSALEDCRRPRRADFCRDLGKRKEPGPPFAFSNRELTLCGSTLCGSSLNADCFSGRLAEFSLVPTSP